MTNLYYLLIVPTDGPALESDTIREWMRDADFTVIKTDYMPFQHTRREQRNGSKFHVTRRDILDAEEHYGITFHITARLNSEGF